METAERRGARVGWELGGRAGAQAWLLRREDIRGGLGGRLHQQAGDVIWGHWAVERWEVQKVSFGYRGVGEAFDRYIFFSTFYGRDILAEYIVC